MTSEHLLFAHAAAGSTARVLPRAALKDTTAQIRSVAEIADELFALVGDLPRFEAKIQEIVESGINSPASPNGLNQLFSELVLRVDRDPRIVKAIKRTLHRENRRRQVEYASLEAEADLEKRRALAWTQYSDWLKSPDSRFALQRVETTNKARLLEAMEDGNLFSGAAPRSPDWWESIHRGVTEGTSFLIEHDWAAAFAKAGQFDDGTFALPAEVCAFEMKIDGHATITMTHVEADTYLFMSTFVRVKNGWVIQGTFTINMADGKVYMWVGKSALKAAVATDMEAGDLHHLPDGKSDRRIIDAIYAQVRAACIALDAEVATSTPQRAEYRRNASRDRNAPTGFSYNVVSLARRSRASRLERAADEEPTQRRRLHFRRGHWRHYDDHKTWIKWMLVGDPELGFVDKHYRL